MMDHKYITCTGFGGTGSSVISDLMKEYDNILSLGSDFEFSLSFDIHGISDLQHYLVDDFERHKVTEGIYAFKKHVECLKSEYNHFVGEEFSDILNDYINNLVLLEWQGENLMQHYRYSNFKRWLYYDYCTRFQHRFDRFVHKKDGYEHTVLYKKKLPMQISVPRDVFFSETKKMYARLLDIHDKEHKYEYMCFDQLVPAYNFERYLNYFPNLKIIVIDRDPRDLYLLNKLYWDEGWIPSQNVDFYIKWFGEIRRDLQADIAKCRDNVLLVKFEDAIYNYDDTIKTIEDFLGLDKNSHVKPQNFFNPKKSKRNTKIWEQEGAPIDDVKKIESQLRQYCYPY